MTDAQKRDEAIEVHEFIVVGRRRWCVNCDLFQMKRGSEWLEQTKDCPRDTPRAKIGEQRGR